MSANLRGLAVRLHARTPTIGKSGFASPTAEVAAVGKSTFANGREPSVSTSVRGLVAYALFAAIVFLTESRLLRGRP